MILLPPPPDCQVPVVVPRQSPVPDAAADEVRAVLVRQSYERLGIGRAPLPPSPTAATIPHRARPPATEVPLTWHPAEEVG